MSERTCSIDDCENPARSRGMCPKHYTRWQRHGDPQTVNPRGSRARPPLERLLRHVDASGDCWEWTAHRNWGGYGVLSGSDMPALVAHRSLWVLLVGPLDESLDLDHLCRNRGCVNPDHLEPVTRLENARRGARWPTGPGVCKECGEPRRARDLCWYHYQLGRRKAQREGLDFDDVMGPTL